MKTSQCKGCGKPIVWAHIMKDGKRTGKKVPLDPRPAVYRLKSWDDEEYEATQALQIEGMVSHFSTCPKASNF